MCFIPSECFKATTSGFSHQQYLGVPDDDAERKDSSGEEDRYKGMLDVEQEDEDGDKARDSKLPQMLKVFVNFFFMIIQKISSGMLCSYNFHKHLLQCILPHVCPDVFLQCILPGRINFIYFLFILHEKLFDVLKVFFFFIFVYSSTFRSYV